MRNRRINAPTQLASIVLLLLWCCACSYAGAKVTSDENASILQVTPSYEEIEYYISEENELRIGHPAGWRVNDLGDIIELIPNEEDELQSSDISYHLFTMPPYTDRGNRRIGIAQTSAEIANDFMDKYFLIDELNAEIINPIENVSINGHDGATFSVKFEGNRQTYEIVLRTAQDQSVLFSAKGLEGSYQTMQSTLNFIALNTSKVEEE